MIVASTATSLLAQAPLLDVTNAIPAPSGGSATWTLDAATGQPYLVAIDLGSGPSSLLGQRFLLDFSPFVAMVGDGMIPPSGQATGSFRFPRAPQLAGLALYLQAITGDPNSPNGSFSVSNGESVCLYDALNAFVQSFENTSRFQGSFDSNAAGVLQGGAVQTRTYSTIDPQGVIFPFPIAGPLNPRGVKVQHAFRTQDVGATGEEELLTAVRWRPFESAAFTDFTLSDFRILAGTTSVTPDYTVDRFSGLPSLPESGLNGTFAQNQRVDFAEIYRGRYVGRAADIRTDGYAPYPALQQSFVYDGVSTLLLQFETKPEVGGFPTIPGQQIRLMVQSSPLPAGRVYASAPRNGVLDPQLTTDGVRDNSMAEYQLEFVRVKTQALGPWNLFSPSDYSDPILATVQPAGTSILVEYQGTDNPSGSFRTPWSTDINDIDGNPFLRYRVTFVANPVTGEVPAIDTIVIPHD